MNLVDERINELRKIMLKEHIDYVYVPTDDDHLSEYVGDYYKEREFISGFTGSAGVCLISLQEAILWTDGRYFIQAELELANSQVKLYKMGEEGVPSFLEYLKKHMKENETLCVNSRFISVKFGLSLEKIIKEKNARMVNLDLIECIWIDRPEVSKKEAYLLSKKITGETRLEKINAIQMHLKENNIYATAITSLDDIMWTLNLRGWDVDYNPVVLSFLMVYQDKVVFYCYEEVLTEEIKNQFLEDGIEIREYSQIYLDAEALEHQKISLDFTRTNYALYQAFQKNEIIDEVNFTLLPKAIKNRTEIRNMKKAHLKDAVAVTKFIYWLKHDKSEKTELSAAKKLLEFRKQQDNFLEESFATICAYASHGAIVHYEATEKTNVKITNNQFLLVDSGGQYLEGTTDITRTIVLGKVPMKMKKDFTMVLKGHLDLMSAEFLSGVRGDQLDILARTPLWKESQNYNHGTGHGVGMLLNVHEGPNNISYQRSSIKMEPGMITSNEPGLYIAGEYGIRHENLILCCKKKKNEYGQFLNFETLTLVPFDRSGINKKYLTKEEIKTLNDYHKRVYQEISPFLNAKERAWLFSQTKAI